MNVVSPAIALSRSISPWLEMGAYEALWSEAKQSFKRIADRFRANPGAVPSDFIQQAVAEKMAEQVMEIFRKANILRFGVRINGAGEYPDALRMAKHPIELLYFQGWWDLINSPSVAVVGTRKPTEEGMSRVRKLVRHLVEDQFTVVSGLAAGIDTLAHRTAIDSGGRTIGVLGTPLSATYPPENQDLQQEIASKFLLVSQVPVLRYAFQNPFHNKFFFPARNVTMAALTQATVIIEAGETSGTLFQANAALHQGKFLFILDSCFQNKDLTWPKRLEDQGAIRVKDYEDIRSRLGPQIQQDRPA
jgi:DNA processing protein